MIAQTPNVVTKLAHDFSLLHDARLQFDNLLEQRIDEIGTFRIAQLSALVMDLSDEPRAGFHVGLQIVKACLGGSGDVSRIQRLPFLPGLPACL